MKNDANKGITQILYTHLNLPSRIAIVKGGITSTIDYVYSASGAKLRVMYRPNVLSPLSTTTDYVNGCIFTNNNLSMARTDNGYYTLSSTGDPTYYFYLKDHQGNNRVVVAENDSIVQTNHYYPYGALFAESTNGDVQRFKYNGKELDRNFGLNWYDHGARHNDAAIGRWHSMDPLAEVHPQFSPYSFCMGDPVNFGDYDGQDALLRVCGDTIIISARIVLTGQLATQELADIYKQGIMDTWSPLESVNVGGTNYSIAWDIDVSVDNSIDLDNGDLPMRDGMTNYLQVVATSYKNGGNDAQSGVNINGYTGHIRNYGRSGYSLSDDNPIGHEFGHLMGLTDKYQYVQRNGTNITSRPISDKWIASVMGTKSGDGYVKPYELDNILLVAVPMAKISGLPIRIGYSTIREPRIKK